MTTQSIAANTDELTFVKLLISGHSVSFAAAVTGLDETEARAAAERLGHPDIAQLRAAALRLRRELDDQESDDLPGAETVVRRGQHVVDSGVVTRARVA